MTFNMGAHRKLIGQSGLRMAEENPFDVHTEIVEEFREKIFYVLGDLLGGAGATPRDLPESGVALLEGFGACQA